MPWSTKVFESYDAWAAAGRPIGGVFPVNLDTERKNDTEWGDPWPDRYKAMRDAGGCYWVALPGPQTTDAAITRTTGQVWCPWRKAFNKEQLHYGEGWDVTGPPERLTAKPSIQTSAYHGFLTDGVLSDG